MMKLKKREHSKAIEFCERCGSVCDATCLAEASRQQAFDRLLGHGWRLA